LTVPFNPIAADLDFGMVMTDSLNVDAQASARRYAGFHRDWPARVAGAARELGALKPDLVLANVPYLSLAAAQQAGIPAVALCCINWADIYRHYCGDSAVAEEIELAYQTTTAFLRPAPAMPMSWLRNLVDIGPLASLGHDRRPELERLLRLKPGDRLLLVSLGGIPHPLDVSRWPIREGWHWVVPDDWNCARPDMTPIGKLNLPYRDVFASCDAIISKPGYGTFAEAGCHAKPLLYVPRDGWPEQPCLVEWLQRVGRCAAITLGELESGELHEPLEALLAAPAKPPVPPTGIAEAADYLAALL
jgi:hypothetical protein